MLYGARTLFAIVILFEILNGLSILRVPLDFSWFGLTVTATAVWAAIEVAFARERYRDGRASALLVGLGVVMLDLAGDVLHLYSRIIWYDKVLHVIGGGVAGYLIYRLIAESDAIKAGAVRWLSVVGITSLLGIAYEAEEWFEDMWVHGTTLRLGNGPDTIDDMLMNVIGAAVVVGIITIYEKRKTKHKK